MAEIKFEANRAALILVLSTMIVSGCASSLKTKDHVAEIRFSEIETSTTTPFRPDSSKPIAVIPFIDAVNSQNSGSVVAQIISDELVKEGFRTVDRSSLREILTERALLQSGVISDGDIVDIGSKIGASYMLHGMVKKYSSIEVETKGASVTSVLPTQYGAVAFTQNSENKKRELYTTKFIMKIIDISSGLIIFRADFDIQKSQLDNEKSVSLAVQQMLFGEYYKAKTDSIYRGIFRQPYASGADNKYAIHSLLEDALVMESAPREVAYEVARKIAHGIGFVRVVGGEIFLRSPFQGGGYLYCDSANLNKAALKATKLLFEDGDSAGVMNMLSIHSAYLGQQERAEMAEEFKLHSNSFSAVHRDALRLRYGLILDAGMGQRCFDKQKPCRPKAPNSIQKPVVTPIPSGHNNARYR